MANGEITVHFVKDVDTKNTYRFEEVDENGEKVPPDAVKVGRQYVQKRTWPKGSPPRLKIILVPEFD